MTLVHVPTLSKILEQRAGLDLGRGGMEASLVTYVTKRLVCTGLDFEQYVAQLESIGSDELRALVEAMTVVYTWFFRDPGQFAVLEQLIGNFAGDRPMSIWVAGCATGEEAYSIALVASESGKRVDILGTDLNTTALEHAKAGRYALASLNAVDTKMRERFLQDASEQYVVPNAVRQSVRFQHGNLVETAPRAPSSDGWDLIICRNVLIYFSKEQARRALDSMANALRPGGFLVLGASEAILDQPTHLVAVTVAGRTVLERPKAGQPRATPSAPRPYRSSPTQSGVETRSEPRILPHLARRMAPAFDALGGPRFPTSGVERAWPVTPGAPKLPDGGASKTELSCGLDALEAGDVPAAKAHLARAVQLDATCAEAAMLAGMAYYLDGDFETALRLLRGALCLNANLWGACFYQALCYENLGYAEDAARTYGLVLKTAADAEGTVGPAFLDHWRSDMLAVAKKRSRSNDGRDSSSQKLRASPSR